MAGVADLLRQIPKVDEVLREEAVASRARGVPRGLVIRAIRDVLEGTRAAIREGRIREVDKEGIVQRVLRRIEELGTPSLRRVINATGVVLHTNLGRAPLSRRALERVLEVGRYYSNLEYDLRAGRRGHRHSHVEDLLCEVTGAEAATVVNNNAGAVLLALNTLAEGKEVIVSRGELVEIGGSFRVPEVMAKSGAILREVGTTNRTHLFDYERAIGDNTAMLLKVHTSNYKIVGFTADVPLRDLVDLGRKYGLLVMEDLGSGLLLDLSPWGLRGEPTVAEAIRAGADLVTFSGDKLLGGPQAGIILGRRDLIEAIRKNPLSRALRVDKFTLSALEGTLWAYRDPEVASREIPALRMITMPQEEVRRRARRLRGLILKEAPALEVKVLRDSSRIGGGSFPLAEIPTWVVGLRAPGLEAQDLEARLRAADPPVVARISEDWVVLDPRTVFDEELPLLAKAVAQAVRAGNGD